MTKVSGSRVRLRPKRQITLPPEICDELSLQPGDVLELTVEGGVLVARPSKRKALDALKEIRECFRRSGITEEELLRVGREARRGLSRGTRGAGG